MLWFYSESWELSAKEQEDIIRRIIKSCEPISLFVYEAPRLIFFILQLQIISRIYKREDN